MSGCAGLRVRHQHHMGLQKFQFDANFTHRIVEYATRDEAQTAINNLSNKPLAGRLVYVREVSAAHSKCSLTLT